MCTTFLVIFQQLFSHFESNFFDYWFKMVWIWHWHHGSFDYLGLKQMLSFLLVVKTGARVVELFRLELGGAVLPIQHFLNRLLQLLKCWLVRQSTELNLAIKGRMKLRKQDIGLGLCMNSNLNEDWNNVFMTRGPGFLGVIAMVEMLKTKMCLTWCS
jgi:hypothetical protein